MGSASGHCGWRHMLAGVQCGKTSLLLNGKLQRHRGSRVPTSLPLTPSSAAGRPCSSGLLWGSLHALLSPPQALGSHAVHTADVSTAGLVCVRGSLRCMCHCASCSDVRQQVWTPTVPPLAASFGWPAPQPWEAGPFTSCLSWSRIRQYLSLTKQSVIHAPQGLFRNECAFSFI